ncbi:MAG: biopolymer transporter ExbD [Flavobacteriia bacterium]|nr:biopolymer transporter ExbD [Flavobacteriia bacterium]
MAKFKKSKSGEMPGVNTSSLPDIVFMLLFFFMVATTTKETDPTVIVDSPIGVKATDLTPYKQRSEIDFAYLGKPRNTKRLKDFKMGFALSLDNVVDANADQLYSTESVSKWKQAKFDSKPSKMRAPIESVITCVKADKSAPTGLIFDIRKQLQNVNALTIAYAVREVNK